MIYSFNHLRANVDKVSAKQYNRLVDTVEAMYQSLMKNSFMDTSGIYLRRQPVKCMNYIDRGTASGVDFSKNDGTFDSAYHNLDLSSIVDAGAKAVLLTCSGQASNNWDGDSPLLSINFRGTENSTPIYNNTGMVIPGPAVYKPTFSFITPHIEYKTYGVRQQFIVPLDKDGVIDWYIAGAEANWSTIFLIINGWFK